MTRWMQQRQQRRVEPSLEQQELSFPSSLELQHVCLPLSPYWWPSCIQAVAIHLQADAGLSCRRQFKGPIWPTGETGIHLQADAGLSCWPNGAFELPPTWAGPPWIHPEPLPAACCSSASYCCLLDCRTCWLCLLLRLAKLSWL